MEGRPLVLFVEDDDLLGEVVAHNLRAAGFRVEHQASAKGAASAWRRADIIVLDWMLPDESGLALLRRMRTHAGELAPVLMLTARSQERDRVEGLEAGADDYLVKPFGTAELVARLRALLRRTTIVKRLSMGNLELELEAGQARLDGEPLTLTRREFDLLAHLMAHPGKVFSRHDLLAGAWGEDYVGTERTVDQHVAQLRARLGADHIETVRGRGYRFRPVAARQKGSDGK